MALLVAGIAEPDFGLFRVSAAAAFTLLVFWFLFLVVPAALLSKTPLSLRRQAERLPC